MNTNFIDYNTNDYLKSKGKDLPEFSDCIFKVVFPRKFEVMKITSRKEVIVIHQMG